MPSGTDITRGRYATVLETSQTRPIGQRIADNKSQRIWTYVRFDQILNVGNWVRDHYSVKFSPPESRRIMSQKCVWKWRSYF